MPKDIKMCGCNACKSGRHCAKSRATTDNAKRRQRKAVKQALATGNEVPGPTGAKYTD
jgi:hypothetical protein